MKTILIIDDDEDFRGFLKDSLESNGYNVITAVNGCEAINIFKKDCTDLVITDMIMPEKEGLETIMEIKRLCKDTKIIAISGGGLLDAGSYLDMAKRAGVLSTLKKPFRREQLLETVHEVL